MPLAIVEITSTEVEERSGTSAKNGKPYHFRRQGGWLYTGDVHPLKFDVSLEDGSHPYQPGRYSLDAKSFRMGQYGPELARYLKLEPLDSAARTLTDAMKATSPKPAV